VRLRKPKRLPFLLARVSRTDGQRAYVCSGCHRWSWCAGPAGARRACRRLDGLSGRGGASIGDPLRTPVVRSGAAEETAEELAHARNGRPGRPAWASGVVDAAAVPDTRKLASPRRASIIWLTRSVRSPLAITQQITARTTIARNTRAPSAGMPSSAGRAAGRTPAAVRPACLSMFATARITVQPCAAAERAAGGPTSPAGRHTPAADDARSRRTRSRLAPTGTPWRTGPGHPKEADRRRPPAGAPPGEQPAPSSAVPRPRPH
jgi:hypothetical protein